MPPRPQKGRGLVYSGEALLPVQPNNTSSGQAMAMYAPGPQQKPDTGNASAQPTFSRRINILEWKHFPNALGGWVKLVDNEIGIILDPVCLRFNPDGTPWIGLPASPRLRSGAVDLSNGGKPTYTAHIKIVPRERWDSFQAAVLEALQQHPEAGRCWS